MDTIERKTCIKCEKKKLGLDFYKGNTCKTCSNKNRVQRQYELKLKAIAYKGGKCIRCGYDKHYAALTFHHLRDKEMNWNQMRNKCWEKTRVELDKCQLLCVNCHYITHAEEDSHAYL